MSATAVPRAPQRDLHEAPGQDPAVEDDRENCAMLKEALLQWAIPCATSSPARRPSASRPRAFDIVLTDIRMAGPDGLGVLKAFASASRRRRSS